MDADGLALSVELAGPAVARRSAFLALRVANRGGSALRVSARLNLFEGDVRLLRRDPSGETRRLDGWQIDTVPAEVELPPGCSIMGAVNLLDAGDGPVLGEAGPHELAAEYFPAVARPPLESPWLRVEAAEPAADAGLDSLLEDRWLRRALVKADAREAPEAMDRLAAGFPERVEGELARLIVAGGRGEADKLDWTAMAARDGATGLAVRLLALRTPYGEAGARLTEAYAAALDSVAADSAERELARKMVLREPISG